MSERVFTSKERTFERTQGCWNCKHSSPAKGYWQQKRQQDLKRALDISLASPRGEQDPKVETLREWVDRIDNLVAVKQLVRCTTGRQPNGDELPDLVQHSYLCDKWSGASGSSLARDIGKTDLLPDELVDRVDGDGSYSAAQVSDILSKNAIKLLGRKKVD